MKPKNTDRLYYSLWGVIALFLLLNPAAQAEEDNGGLLTIRDIVKLGQASASAKDKMELYLAGAAAADRVHRYRTLVHEVTTNPEYETADWLEPPAMVAYEYLEECGVWSGETLFVLAQLAVLDDNEMAGHYPGAFVVNVNSEKCGNIAAHGGAK